jgi:hypothetical protein
VASNTDIHISERSILGYERVEEIQDIDIDSPLSGRTLDPRALPRLAANGLVKTKWPDAVRVQQKKGTPKRQLQSFAREKSLPWVVRQSHHTSRRYMSETQHEAHRRGPQSWFPQAPIQRRASAPNDPGQWHLATNHQDDRWLSSPVSINNRGRDPLSDISLNTTNIHNADQQQRTGESISDTLRLDRTDFGTISALLNHDNNNPTTTFATTQDSLQGAEDGCTEPVSGVAGIENFRFQ